MGVSFIKLAYSMSLFKYNGLSMNTKLICIQYSMSAQGKYIIPDQSL